MADIYVNFPSVPVGYIRGTIDFDLEELVEGWGNVSGGGAALKEGGFHVDLELETSDPKRVDEFLVILRRYLRSLPAPEGTELVVLLDGPEGGVHLPV